MSVFLADHGRLFPSVEIDVDEIKIDSLSSHFNLDRYHFHPEISQRYGFDLLEGVLGKEFFNEENFQVFSLEEHEYFFDDCNALINPQIKPVGANHLNLIIVRTFSRAVTPFEICNFGIFRQCVFTLVRACFSFIRTQSNGPSIVIILGAIASRNPLSICVA